MAFDYDAILDKADTLLVNFGQTMTLVEVDQGTYNPDTGGHSGASTTNHSVTGVILEYSARAGGNRLADGSLIEETDRKVLISPKGMTVVPQAGRHRLTVGSDTYEIVRVKQLSPAGTNVLYELQVRK